jgi:hypothetical protein
MKTKTPCVVLLAMIAAGAASSASAADNNLSFSAGYEYSSGKYGTNASTNIADVPLVASYEAGPWTVNISATYLSITGNQTVVPGLGNVKAPPKIAVGTRTQSGWGDLVVSAKFNLYETAAQDFGIDLVGKAKLSTANAGQGLGDGSNDSAAEVDVYKAIGPVTLFGSLAYTSLGQSSYVKHLNSTFVGYSVGASYQINENTQLGAYYDSAMSSEATDAPDPQRAATIFLNYDFAKHWTVEPWVSAGFSKRTPSYDSGVLLKYAF